MRSSPNNHPRPPRVLVAQLGARRHYAVPRALQEAGLLEQLQTDLYAATPAMRLLPAAWPAALRPSPLRRLAGRSAPSIPSRKVRTHPWLAFSRTLRRHGADTHAGLLAGYLDANRAFCRRVTRAGFGRADTVYVFNAAGFEILAAAKERGLRTALDQTAAPWSWDERLLRDERQRWPGWEEEGPAGEAAARMTARERKEWALADRIICGSSHVLNAVRAEGGPHERCVVVPYACPPVSAANGRPDDTASLRVLFAGTLQLRKGIPYLVEAARSLKEEPVYFRAAGPNRLAPRGLANVRRHLDYVGPQTKRDLSRLFRWADVLVLPTLSEGSANVCYEALAHRLPVITTHEAGSIVRDGIEGLLVPSRDAAALAEGLLRLARDRAMLDRLSNNAAARAAEYGWERYRAHLCAAVIGTMAAS